MDHPKNSCAHVSTETKSKFSPRPKSKKPKLSDSPCTTHVPMQQQELSEVEGHAESNMAAPTVKRPLFSEALTDSPPQWFRAFEDRLDSKIDSLFEKVTKRSKNRKKKYRVWILRLKRSVKRLTL